MENGFFSGAAVIGIQSQETPYHLCWKINEYLDFNFSCDPDMAIYSSDEINSVEFPVYQYIVPNSSELFLLYQIKRSRLSLVGRAKKNSILNQLDYIWLHKTIESGKDAVQYVRDLMAIPGVLYAQIVEEEQFTFLNNLII